MGVNEAGSICCGVTLMPSEIVLFDLHDVLITSRRFTVAGRSFALRSIRSLQFIDHGRSWRPAAASASLSVVAAIAAATTANTALAIPAAGLFLLATVLFVYGLQRFSLALHTDDGFFVPLVSRDRFVVEGVAKVLQSAAHALPVNPHAEPPHGAFVSQPRLSLVDLDTFLPSGERLRASHLHSSQSATLPIAHGIHSL